MWIRYWDLQPIHEAYCATLGRAILVAQAFEGMCLRSAVWWDAAKQLDEGLAVDIIDMAMHIEHFMENVLGKAVRKLVDNHLIAEETGNTLLAAKDARNYFAHEAAHPCLFSLSASSGKAAIAPNLDALSENAQHLADGQNLLACWAYLLEENEPPPPALSQRYPGELKEWILAPLTDELQNTSTDTDGQLM